MPRNVYTLRDVATLTAVLNVACRKCERRAASIPLGCCARRAGAPLPSDLFSCMSAARRARTEEILAHCRQEAATGQHASEQAEGRLALDELFLDAPSQETKTARNAGRSEQLPREPPSRPVIRAQCETPDFTCGNRYRFLPRPDHIDRAIPGPWLLAFLHRR